MKPVEEIAREIVRVHRREHGYGPQPDAMVDAIATALRAERERAERAEAERDEARANLNIARQDGHHDGYADGAKSTDHALATARNRALEEAAEKLMDMKISSVFGAGCDSATPLVAAEHAIAAILSLRTPEAST